MSDPDRSHADLTFAPGEGAPVSERIGTFFARLVTEPFMRGLYHAHLSGSENIPRSGPAVLAANHQSFLDPIAIGLLFQHRLFRSIARSGLFTPRAMGALLRSVGAVPLRERGTPKEAIKIGVNQLKEGRLLAIFPEGTRTPDGTVRPLKPGLIMMLKRAEAPVVPIAIEGAFDIWPPGRPRPRAHGRLRAKALPAIPHEVVRADPRAFLENLRETLETARLDLRREIRERTDGRYPIDPRGENPYWTGAADARARDDDPAD